MINISVTQNCYLHTVIQYFFLIIELLMKLYNLHTTNISEPILTLKENFVIY